MPDNKATINWNQRLLIVLWVWISIRTLLPWLEFFRLTFEGDSYRWGTGYFGRSFHSTGLARADFLLIYALLGIGIFLLYQLRKCNFKLAVPAVLLYLAIFAAAAAYNLFQGNPIVFRGDTLGISLNITIVFFVLQFGMLLVGIAWWYGVKDAASRPGPAPMGNYRKWIVKACVAFVPVQLILLIGGEPHGLSDQIGVIGTLLQGALLAYAFFPGSG